MDDVAAASSSSSTTEEHSVSGMLLAGTALVGIGVASAYYYATRPRPEQPLVPLDNQSPILPVSSVDARFFCLLVRFSNELISRRVRAAEKVFGCQVPK